LALAHKICYDKADKYLSDGFNVIIDNTNTNSKDRKKYEKLAEKYEAEVVFVEPEANWRYDLEELVKRNEKGVPRETIERQMNGAIQFWNSKKGE
jgi:predicted kinase